MRGPYRLYDIAIRAAVTESIKSKEFLAKDFRSLPNNVLFDFYYTMYMEKKLCLLAIELGQLDVFLRMLTVKHLRVQLLRSFQSLIDHGSNTPEELVAGYKKLCLAKQTDEEVAIGLKIGGFFNEGGWYVYTKEILDLTEALCLKRQQDVKTLRQLLECYHRRIYAETVYCNFHAAEKTLKSAKATVEELEKLNAVPNLAGLYTHFSLVYFHRSEYDEAYAWCKKALKLLDHTVPQRIVIEVLRQASRACVVKRNFAQAGLLIRQAYNLAQEIFEVDGHPHFSDTLLDYGFFLLNYDSIHESVKIYERSLQIRKDVFERNNIQVALAHEDMAYALYVNEYSSGRFYAARYHHSRIVYLESPEMKSIEFLAHWLIVRRENAERSIRLMERILPEDHLLLASAKRVKALILEEIALDLREGENSQMQDRYLNEAEELHRSALDLAHKAFGEKNVQTAKHYGNLGRLYQSMKQYNEAEAMHLKAIAIKEELLGSEDYEVGLSVGHLASLYNYHMKRPLDAEKLYMRSMEINMNLFGETYSGFEYDYRGLIHVYSKLNDHSNVLFYTVKMREWNHRRSLLKPGVYEEESLPLGEIVDKFFKMCS